jgi:hypothetical protein
MKQGKTTFFDLFLDGQILFDLEQELLSVVVFADGPIFSVFVQQHFN